MDVLIFLDSIFTAACSHALFVDMVRLGCTEYSNYEVYETFCKKSIVYEKLNMFKLIPHVLMNTYSNIMLCKLKLLHFFNEKSLNSYFSNIDTVNFYNIYLDRYIL